MSKPDEKAIERDYRAGVLSQQGVADKYGITLKALRYMAQKNGWIRIKALKGKGAKAGQKRGAKKNPAPVAQDKAEAAAAQDGVIRAEGQKRSGADPDRSHNCPELSDKESLFVSYYLESLDKYSAYRRAGFKGGDRNARILYRKPAVARAINQGIEKLSRKVMLSAEDILRHWQEIATADPNDLSQLRRCCCRYCWGENFHYQWRDIDEYDKAAEKASADGKPSPDYGGLGFIPSDDPNPECPRCGGEGFEAVFLSDTRDLSGAARRLFAGVKQTKFGIELITRDQDAALKNLAAFHHLAVSEHERELRALRVEQARLANEKTRAEIEAIRNGRKDGELVVVHNALQVPGAIQPVQDNGEGD